MKVLKLKYLLLFCAVGYNQSFLTSDDQDRSNPLCAGNAGTLTTNSSRLLSRHTTPCAEEGRFQVGYSLLVAALGDQQRNNVAQNRVDVLRSHFERPTLPPLKHVPSVTSAENLGLLTSPVHQAPSSVNTSSSMVEFSDFLSPNFKIVAHPTTTPSPKAHMQENHGITERNNPLSDHGTTSPVSPKKPANSGK